MPDDPPDVSDANYAQNYSDAKPAEGAASAPAGAPAAEGDEDDEGFGMSDVLLDSVTKDEWKSIEASLSHHKKIVAEMLKRACAQVRTKGDLVMDDSNGKFLGDMLTEMDNFATWCYKVRAAVRLSLCSRRRLVVHALRAWPPPVRATSPTTPCARRCRALMFTARR
jgi:hypothetical protein